MPIFPAPASTSATTVATLIEQTRRHLQGTHREWLNTLDGAISPDAVSVALTYKLNGITQGALLSIDDELIYVISADTAALTASVIRGYGHTTPDSHASGTTIYVNPRFPKAMIRDALQTEIAAWGENIFATAALNITGATNTRSYDLTGIPASPTEWYDVLQIWRPPYNTTTSDGTGTTWVPVDARVVRDMPTTSFASGVALQLEEPLRQSLTLRVVYSKPFNVATFTDGVDVVATIGVPISAFDIPPLGAAWRLLVGREAVRTFTEQQGESREAQDVPAGSIQRIAAGFKALRDGRVEEEAAKMRLKHAARQWA